MSWGRGHTVQISICNTRDVKHEGSQGSGMCQVGCHGSGRRAPCCSAMTACLLKSGGLRRGAASML